MWAAHQLDIGVVARFGTSDVALVFRCETDAKGVAAAIHANCLRLANEIKLAKERQRPLGAQNGKNPIPTIYVSILLFSFIGST